MKTYEGNLKTTGRIERRMARQRFENLSSFAWMIVVQLLVAAFLIVATIVLPAHAAAAETEHPLGDHPAVIVFKKWTKPEYVSRTAIYPHPATMWWYMQDPNAPDHPLPGAHP
jgi:hypothetical protein